MMTPEQKFARWVRVSIAAFLGIFAWFIVADIWIPLTPDSTVMRVVTPVSSRVSGYVSHVYVHNNSQVKKGDLLYELDPTPFINKVEAAQIALEQAKLSNQQLDAQIAAARANLRTAQYTARNDKVTLDRYQRLSTMQNVSQSDLDKVRTTWQTSEQSVSALNAQIQNLLIQRGERDDKRNVTLQKYRNALEEAQLNLAWTKVRAETDGMVSNLQLNPGIYATAATAVLALVNNNTDIVADFREKSLRHTAVNTDAAVVFDALPGEVFPAHVTSSDAGILAGVINAMARRSANFIGRLSAQGPLLFTGGVSHCAAFARMLESHVGMAVTTHPDAQFAGAIGAALIGQRQRRRG